MSLPVNRETENLAEWGDVLVISPHLDDALLSAYEIIHRTGAEVWTVFAGEPDPPMTTDWDRTCGFPDSHTLMVHRRAEDIAACDVAGARYRHLNGLDGAYTDPPRRQRDLEQMSHDLLDWLGSRPGHRVTVVLPACAGTTVPPSLFDLVKRVRSPRASASREASTHHTPPTDAADEQVAANKETAAAPSSRPITSPSPSLRDSLRHLAQAALHREYQWRRHWALRKGWAVNNDHLAVRNAGLAVLANQPGIQIVLAEDLPYLWGAPADAEIARVARQHRWMVSPREFTVDRHGKHRAIAHYTSQLSVLEPSGRLSAADSLPTIERSWVLRSNTR